MFASQYKNVLFDMDRQLSNFLEWLEGQEFYENTTVVILGDHLYMDSHKYIYQLHVNGKKYQNRIFSHFDIFPALIDSIGGVYDAKGLALGRSMNEPPRRKRRGIICRAAGKFINYNELPSQPL